MNNFNFHAARAIAPYPEVSSGIEGERSGVVVDFICALKKRRAGKRLTVSLSPLVAAQQTTEHDVITVSNNRAIIEFVVKLLADPFSASDPANCRESELDCIDEMSGRRRRFWRQLDTIEIFYSIGPQPDQLELEAVFWREDLNSKDHESQALFSGAESDVVEYRGSKFKRFRNFIVALLSFAVGGASADALYRGITKERPSSLLMNSLSMAASKESRHYSFVIAPTVFDDPRWLSSLSDRYIVDIQYAKDVASAVQVASPFPVVSVLHPMNISADNSLPWLETHAAYLAVTDFTLSSDSPPQATVLSFGANVFEDFEYGQKLKVISFLPKEETHYRIASTAPHTHR